MEVNIITEVQTRVGEDIHDSLVGRGVGGGGGVNCGLTHVSAEANKLRLLPNLISQIIHIYCKHTKLHFEYFILYMVIQWTTVAYDVFNWDSPLH